MLFVLLAVAGVANAVTQPAINLFVAEQIPADRQGLGFGIKQSGIPAAILVSGLALPVLALPLGWRVTLAVCALAPLAVGLALPARRGRPRVAPAGVAAARRARCCSRRSAPRSARPGPSALGAYLVASRWTWESARAPPACWRRAASALSLATRVIALGARADRRRDYGLAVVVMLLAAGSVGFALMSSHEAAVFVLGALVAFTLGWGWPGLFNLAVVDSNRETPGSASGVSQTGIYVGAAFGPAAFGALASTAGYGTAWAAVAVMTLLSAGVSVARAHAKRRFARVPGFDLSGPGITQTQPPGPVFGTYGFPRPCPGNSRYGPGPRHPGPSHFWSRSLSNCKGSDP